MISLAYLGRRLVVICSTRVENITSSLLTITAGFSRLIESVAMHTPIKSYHVWRNNLCGMGVLVSNNGLQFTSALFQKFIKDWEIAHKPSSPNFPQSNGLAERPVQTAKDILTKTDLTGDNFKLAMLKYRNTPVDGLASPVQMLMSRNLRSIVPCTGELLSPKIVHHGEFVQNREK